MRTSFESNKYVIFSILFLAATNSIGWSLNSGTIHNDVFIKNVPSDDGETIGIAKQGYRFDLINIKNKWGQILMYDENSLTNTSFPEHEKYHIGWIYTEDIRYELNGLFNQESLGTDMILKNYRDNEQALELLEQLNIENASKIPDILYCNFAWDANNPIPFDAILLSDHREEFLEKVVDLFFIEDKQVTWLIKQELLLLPPPLQVAISEKIQHMFNEVDNSIFRYNAIELLDMMHAKGYPVNFMIFVYALNDSVEKIRDRASHYFAFGLDEIMSFDNVKEIIMFFPNAIYAKSRIKYLVVEQIRRLYEKGSIEKNNNHIEKAITYYQILLDVVDLADHENFDFSGYTHSAVFKKLPDVKEFVESNR